jgi:hypothetical protein
VLILGGLSSSQPGFTEEKIAYHAVASYVEGCSCNLVCTCTMTGLNKHSCSFVTAMVLKNGTYNGVFLKGVKVGAGGLAGDRIYVYVDAPESEREAATGFVKTLYAELGKIQAVRNVRIDLLGKDGRYTLKIDDGKTAELTI